MLALFERIVWLHAVLHVPAVATGWRLFQRMKTL